MGLKMGDRLVLRGAGERRMDRFTPDSISYHTRQAASNLEAGASVMKTPTEKIRELQVSGRGGQLLGALAKDPVNTRVATTVKKIAELKLGSDSCYSRSEHSSTDSESLPNSARHLSCHQSVKRGDVKVVDQQQSRLDRLCPRVRGVHYDSTSLSSVDTSSSSDLWNVRAMPDVPVAKLSKPISLRANPGLRHSSRPSFLDHLTDELLVKVLSYLSSRQLMGVARVCRRFYFLAWEPELWQRLSFTDDAELDVDRALKTTFQLVARNGVNLPSTVRAIHLSGCSRLTDRGLALIARRCSLLLELELQNCLNITNGGLLDLTTRCQQLHHLDISGCPMVSAVNIPVHPPGSKPDIVKQHLNIQYLDLSDCPHVDDTSLRLVVESCPQLQFLYLRRCHQVTDASLRSIASYCLLLRELSVSDCPLLSDQGLTELGRLGPSLRYLSVAKCNLLTDAGVRTLARHCYRLRYLNLRGCEQVSDSAVDWLSKSCTRLRSLDIGKCDVSDLGLKLLSENCPNLKKLSVKSCALVTDRGVECVSYYCRGLQHLNIQDVAGVTSQGYRAVKNNCRKCIIEHTNPGFH